MWDGSRRAHAGYVPRDLAPGVGQVLRGREPFSAGCHVEFLDDGRRIGFSVLLAPTAFSQSLTVDEDLEEDN